MRDDIHRRLPLPRAWKRLAKACVREAEAGRRGFAAIHALQGELRQVRSSFCSALEECGNRAAGCLFPRDEFARFPLEPSTPCESAALAHAKALAASGTRRLDLVPQALAAAVADRAEAHIREAHAHVALDAGPTQARELTRRMKDAVFGVDCLAVARNHLDNKPQAPAPALDLDADLRRQP